MPKSASPEIVVPSPAQLAHDGRRRDQPPPRAGADGGIPHREHRPAPSDLLQLPRPVRQRPDLLGRSPRRAASGSSPASAWISASTGWARASTSKPCCCSLRRASNGCSGRRQQNGSPRLDVVPDPASGSIRLLNGNGGLPRGVAGLVRQRMALCARARPRRRSRRSSSLTTARRRDCASRRNSAPWLEGRRRAEERKQLRRDYELKVQSGEWPAHETKVPLFPYQREGMLHLAFTERALLADEMGLGKTIQAIAACALLHRLGQADRVLVVTPASLEDRMGGADSALHRAAVPARVR